MAGPTPKQQRFVDAYIVEPNAAKAAITAGYQTNNAKQMGSQVLDATRPIIEEKLAAASLKAEITLERHLKRLNRLSHKAELAEQYTAAITAETNRGKAAGLYIERTESKNQHDHIIRVVRINGLRDGDE